MEGNTQIQDLKTRSIIELYEIENNYDKYYSFPSYPIITTNTFPKFVPIFIYYFHSFNHQNNPTTQLQ